jgi:long-chain acyl-CoA synthetase
LEAAFQKIRETFGGRLKLIITGSAPISGEVLNFFRVVLGVHLIEGFGATETGGCAGFTFPNDSSTGNVGIPLLCNKYKLGDVPEMGLVAKRDNKGEVIII